MRVTGVLRLPAVSRSGRCDFILRCAIPATLTSRRAQARWKVTGMFTLNPYVLDKTTIDSIIWLVLLHTGLNIYTICVRSAQATDETCHRIGS